MAGGQGFIRAVVNELDKHDYRHTAYPYHQSANKESRILTYAHLVYQFVYFPVDYQTRFHEFSLHLHKFKRNFTDNEHDDAEDTLTGVYEFIDNIIKI